MEYSWLGLPWWLSDKESTCNGGRLRKLRFYLWVGKRPWRRKWQPTPVFLPGKISWTEEPGGLQSMGLQRVRHDWSDLACSTLFSMWTIHTIRNYSLLIWEKTHYLVCEEFAQLGSRTWLSWQLIIVSATKKQVYRRHIFKQNKFDSHLPLVSLKKKRLILYSELRYSIK